MTRTPRILELGRAPAARDGTGRPLTHLAEHLLASVPQAVLVTLHSRRPVDRDDDLLVWASVWFRGRATGKVPERRLPREVLALDPRPLEEIERDELEALVLELTGSLPGGGREPRGRGLPVMPSTRAAPRLRVLRPDRDAPAAPAADERRPRDRGFLRVLPGGLAS